MFIPDTVKVAVFPARSVALPVTDWDAPSDDSVIMGVTESIPDSSSKALN